LKVGVLGYKGFVGSALYEAFSADKKCEAVGIGRENYAALRGTPFDMLVNANGNSSKRLAESEMVRDFQMNVSSTLEILHDFPCEQYIHISSIEVYPDTGKKAATLESAKIDSDALSNYGFSKYMGELVARKHSKRWLILRPGGMVGMNMKKGPAYDILELGRLFVSEKSKYQYISTRSVARIAKELSGRGRWGEVYNVVGRGSITLSDFAGMAGVKLGRAEGELQEFNVSCDKLSRETAVPETADTVKEFIGEWKRGRQ
jgi:nucleoside-diphosphate-sugar epimerase